MLGYPSKAIPDTCASGQVRVLKTAQTTWLEPYGRRKLLERGSPQLVTSMAPGLDAPEYVPAKPHAGAVWHPECAVLRPDAPPHSECSTGEMAVQSISMPVDGDSVVTPQAYDVS